MDLLAHESFFIRDRPLPNAGEVNSLRGEVK